MTSLPIRWRVTLTFAATLTVVFSAVGVFVYLLMAAELRDAIDRGLRARAEEIAAQLERGPITLSHPQRPIFGDEPNIAQVLTRDGIIVTATPGVDFPLLDQSQLRTVGYEPLFSERPADEHLEEPVRLLAALIRARGDQYVVVVGGSGDKRQEALSSLLLLEVLGLGLALATSSAAGYFVAGLALQPVEVMRQRAQEISAEPDARLPVPVVHDELGRLAKTLNAMLDRLSAAQKAEREAIAKQRRFVADASHELRTPLTILKSEIEVALLGGTTAADLEAALTSAGEESERLCQLAEDLLVLAQSDEGELRIHRERIEVADLLDTVARRQRRRPDIQGRAIVTESPCDLVIYADRIRLEQILTNLVDNAIRHGGGDVELRAHPVREGVRLSVRDHGAGFDEEFIEQAFERFSRATAGSANGGAGLGLAIVEAVARAHGGVAGIDAVDDGALVHLTLPSH